MYNKIIGGKKMSKDDIKKQSFQSIDRTVKKTRESNKKNLNRELDEMPYVRKFLDAKKSKYVCPECKNNENTHEKWRISFEEEKDKKTGRITMIPKLIMICIKCNHNWKVAYKRG